MQRRVKQHETDKLRVLLADIFYFPVKYRADADLIETYLINSNPSCHKFNKSKTRKGSVSFLNDVVFPFVPFTGSVDKNLKPFVIEQNPIKVVTETKYVNRNKYIYKKSIDSTIQESWDCFSENVDFLNNEIKGEEEILIFMCSLYMNQFGFNFERDSIVSENTLLEAIALHRQRMDCLKNVLKDYKQFPYMPKNYNKHLYECQMILEQIEMHENRLKCEEVNANATNQIRSTCLPG